MWLCDIKITLNQWERKKQKEFNEKIDENGKKFEKKTKKNCNNIIQILRSLCVFAGYTYTYEHCGKWKSVVE